MRPKPTEVRGLLANSFKLSLVVLVTMLPAFANAWALTGACSRPGIVLIKLTPAAQ